MAWVKSSYCRTDTPMCVEVYGLDSEYVAVRDSNEKFRVLTFTREEWDSFIAGAKKGEFDLLECPEELSVDQLEQV